LPVVKEKDDGVIRGPAPRRLTSDQYLDAVSQVTGHWPKVATMNVPVPNLAPPGPVRIPSWTSVRMRNSSVCRPRKRVPAESGQERKEHLIGVGDDRNSCKQGQ